MTKKASDLKNEDNFQQKGFSETANMTWKQTISDPKHVIKQNVTNRNVKKSSHHIMLIQYFTGMAVLVGI
jgi:hypothetical protein